MFKQIKLSCPQEYGKGILTSLQSQPSDTLGPSSESSSVGSPAWYSTALGLNVLICKTGIITEVFVCWDPYTTFPIAVSCALIFSEDKKITDENSI